MHRVERQQHLLVLIDGTADSRAVLDPLRGGLVTRFSVAGRELLYLDEATYLDPTANVRGGVPVLFPFPGKLADDRYTFGGQVGSMKQHGFARTRAWEVAGSGTDNGAFVELTLTSDELTRAVYPWDFQVRLTYRLKGRELAFEVDVHNPGPAPLPFGLGFHPYFAVPQAEKAAARIPSLATTSFDNRSKMVGPFSGLDLTSDEVDQHLIDHRSCTMTLEGPGGSIEVHAEPEPARWVVWTLRDRDFVCVEPWTCPGDALNTGDALTILPPQGSSRFVMTLRA